MKSWILFFLGTFAYFLQRFNNRKGKDKFSLSFWIKDNWQELALAFIIDLAIVIIVLDPHTIIDLTKISWVPEWLGFSANLLLSFFIGFGGGAAIYMAFKSKADKRLKSFSRSAIDAEEARRDKDNA